MSVTPLLALNQDVIVGIATIFAYDTKCEPELVSAKEWDILSMIMKQASEDEKANLRSVVNEDMKKDLFCLLYKAAGVREAIQRLDENAETFPETR